MSQAHLLEALDGSRFRVRIIRAGLSKNKNFYPDAVLREAAPLFEGVKVFVKSDRDHLTGQGKDVRGLIGRIVNVGFVPGSADSGELQGTFEALDPNEPIVGKMREAITRNMADVFGLSIDAVAQYQTVNRVRRVQRLERVNSVDLIADASAGGGLVSLTEAVGGSQMAALAPLDIGARIERADLPRMAKDRLLEAFSDPDDVTEESLTEAIDNERSYVSSISTSINTRGDAGKVTGLGRLARVTEAEEDKKVRMLDAFFNPDDNSVRSIRECYVEITGDKNLSGQVQRRRISEALDTTAFGIVLGEAVQRRMVADYRDQGIYDVWRDLAVITPVSDFREQHRVRFGGYGDLPKVAERAPYVDVGSPTDEEAKYKIEKRGGTESVTLEMIRNDDVAAVQRIPIRLSRAAKRTLSKFTLDLMRDNPAIYDGKALFHVDHGNLGSAALSAASLAAGRLAMKRQPEKNSADPIGIPPRFLWVADDLEEEASDLFRRNTNNDANFTQSLPIQVRPVWYWTDANDWYLSADKLDIPSVEVGFLDGREEPEIFIQDSPTVGSVFTNDVITYKIRHIYGGTVTDYRGLYKSVVP